MTLRDKNNLWAIIPSEKEEDNLYNRRLLSYYSLAFSAIWFQEILIVLVVGMILKQPLDGAVTAALVGVPAALAGLGFWKYLEACKVSNAVAAPAASKIVLSEGTAGNDSNQGTDPPKTD